MEYKTTTAVKKIAALRKRRRVLQGGSSAGKTIAILLILIDKAQRKENLVISVVSETMPQLRKGAMRDFLNIVNNHGYYSDDRWNATNSIFKFKNGSVIEFFSAEDSDRVRGPRRDHLFINECNNVEYETYRQLALRTSGIIYLDYNPVEEFWVHENLIPHFDHDFLILTYKDNEGLSDEVVGELEANKDDKNFWQVFGLGQVGSKEGKIYKDWLLVDEIPHEARLISYGLDFGYTNDPTAIVAIYYLNGNYLLNEIAFTKGLSNKQIADILLTQNVAPVFADSAEPKSIDELRLHGITVLSSTKGKGSVSQGIQFVQAQNISVTKSSVNIIKEYRNFMWIKDKDGKPTNEPAHAFKHSMDAISYGLQIKGNLKEEKEYIQPPAELPGLRQSTVEDYQEDEQLPFIPRRRT